MNNVKWKDIAELVGIAAIVASLVFVGLQMRQTHDIALGTLYQMRSDAAREVRVARIDPALYDQSSSKAINGEELDQNDILRLGRMNSVVFNHFENTHYLYQLGFVPAEHWDSDKRQLAGILKNQRRKEQWIEMRGNFRDSFVAEINELMEK